MHKRGIAINYYEHREYTKQRKYFCSVIIQFIYSNRKFSAIVSSASSNVLNIHQYCRAYLCTKHLRHVFSLLGLSVKLWWMMSSSIVGTSICCCFLFIPPCTRAELQAFAFFLMVIYFLCHTEHALFCIQKSVSCPKASFAL